MQVKLSDEDRERLGLGDEWLDVTIERLPVREAEAIEDATGLAAIDAVAEMAPKFVPLSDGKFKARFTARGLRLRVWLGLHRAGKAVPFDDLDFDAGAFLGWTEVETPEGKGEGSQSAEPATP